MSLDLCTFERNAENGLCSTYLVGCGPNEYITQMTVNAAIFPNEGYMTDFKSFICRDNSTGQSREVPVNIDRSSIPNTVVPFVSAQCPSGYESIEWITQGDKIPLGLKTFRLKCKDNVGFDPYIRLSYTKTPPEKTNIYKAPEGKVLQQINVATLDLVNTPSKDRTSLADNTPYAIRTLGFTEKDTIKNFTQNSVVVDAPVFQLGPICPSNNTKCRTFEFDCPKDYYILSGSLESSPTAITSLSELTCIPRYNNEVLHVPYARQGVESKSNKMTTCNKGYKEVQYSTSLTNSGLDSTVNGIRFKCSGDDTFGSWFGASPKKGDLVGTIVCPEHQSLNKLIGTYDINGNWTSIQSTSLDCVDNSRTSYRINNNNNGTNITTIGIVEPGYAWIFSIVFVVIIVTWLFLFSFALKK